MSGLPTGGLVIAAAAVSRLTIDSILKLACLIFRCLETYNNARTYVDVNVSYSTPLLMFMRLVLFKCLQNYV